MHLKKEQVGQLAHRITEDLKKSGVLFKGTEEKILEKVAQVIQRNIDQELQIEDEVKRLMDQYKTQIASGSIDAQKVYQMIKRQVAKEKDFVL